MMMQLLCFRGRFPATVVGRTEVQAEQRPSQRPPVVCKDDLSSRLCLVCCRLCSETRVVFPSFV